MSLAGPAAGPAFHLDERDAFGARVARRLREETVVWLTTVGASGAPVPNPVWFLWDGSDRVLVYSLPEAARVRHLGANSRVALNFDGDGRGSDIVVLSGTAAPAPGEPAADQLPAYVEKYSAGIARLETTPQAFAARYSVALRITLIAVRGY